MVSVCKTPHTVTFLRFSEVHGECIALGSSRYYNKETGITLLSSMFSQAYLTMKPFLLLAHLEKEGFQGTHFGKCCQGESAYPPWFICPRLCL